ncbi:hypothetical protein VTN02DRAFT_1841 [Thermoascus thermophilus]
MLAISMTPQASHLCHPTSDAGCPSSSTTTTATIAPQPISSQHTSVPRDMLSAIPPAESAGHGNNVTKRPKLSLQTTSLPMTFGKSTTGLSLAFATNSAVSPTVLNTFGNAYDFWPSPSAGATPSPSKQRPPRFSSPHATNNREGVPYQLPLGVKSILRNSPLPSSSVRQSMTTGAVTRRVYFPAKKQVSYRYPLEEEIKTVRFTARHSDLSDESDSETSDASGSDESSDLSTPQSDSGASDEEPSPRAKTSSPSQSGKKRRKDLGSERQIRAAALRDSLKGDDYDVASPQTPRQGRPKRQCKWRWTLGPLGTSDAAVDEQNAPPEPAQFSKTDDVKTELLFDDDKRNPPDSLNSSPGLNSLPRPPSR